MKKYIALMMAAFMGTILVGCGGGGGSDPSPDPAPTTPVVTARVYSAAPLAINEASYTREGNTLRVANATYDTTFTSTDSFVTATPTTGTAVVKVGANALLHCPLGMTDGTLAQLQAGKVILSASFERVTNYDEAIGKTFDEFNCGGRFQSVKYETDGTVTLTFQDDSTENLSRTNLWDLQFRPEGLHFTDNGEDNRHYGEMYKITLDGTVRYAFLIRNDEVLLSGAEQSVALFVAR